MSAENSDNILLDDAHERARLVLGTVSRDIDSLRAAGGDATYAEGVARCEEVAGALEDLISRLETGKTAP